MSLSTLTPGTSIKFPLSVLMETVKKKKEECSIDAGPLALTLTNGKKSSATQVNHVPYTPGGINYVETDGEVLSGIFTGCVMTIYSHSGRRRVAHVHTGPHAGEGLDCKDLMKTLLQSPGYGTGFAFKPFDQNRKVTNHEYIVEEIRQKKTPYLFA